MQANELQIEKWRREFPILSASFNGRPLVYLDNAATTQKPRAVITAIKHHYEAQNANVHRGLYALSQAASSAYEGAREKVRSFINAAEDAEIIFTRGTTESINLVAASYGRTFLKSGDEIVISAMEHHSNIVPWQIVCQQTGAKLRVVPMNERGEFLLDEYEKILGPRTRIVAVVHVSNSLGTVNPVEKIIELAHNRGAVVLVDGAQWVAHQRTDVRALDADFYAFSGHKLYGPTGIGILYGKRKLLDAMPPYQGGGDMIRSVTFEKTEYAELPNKFEAGTPHIAGAVGLGAAIDFVQSVGLERIAAHEADLLAYATQKIRAIRGIRIVGTAAKKAGVISMVVESPAIAAMDLAIKLDAHGIAIRNGHHCCQPVMDRFGIPATARASFAMYNTRQDMDALVSALAQIIGGHTHGTEAPSNAPAPVTTAELRFPAPFAASPAAAAEQLAEDFEALGDRDARNQYVLELGEKLPPMPEFLKTSATRVHGCMSVVHLFGVARPGDNRLDFLAESDAHIVRGLIALLQRLFAGQRADDILAFNVEAFFSRIGLDQFISSQRRNGLAGMVKRIRSLADQLVVHSA
jgi:cysteine desulfurase/selenocysteine lyase